MKNLIKISVVVFALISFLTVHSNAQTTGETQSYGSV